MKFIKTKLDDITRCYCTSHIDIDDKCYMFFASENPNSVCNSYLLDENMEKQTVWENDRGGCMSIIPIKGKKGEFLAVNEFYLKVSPSLTKLVRGKKTENGWEVKDLFNLPYLHRFDVLNIEGKNYVVCATIARDKTFKDDWSRPGQVYVGELPEDLENNNVVLHQVADDLYRNHGYCKGIYNGQECGYFGSDQGLFRLTLEDGKWQFNKVLSGNIGEVAINDIDNDGNEEIMTIEPFHGNQIYVYKLIDGEYKRVYQYGNEIDFAHALVSTQLTGKNCFVAGIRRKDCEIFVLTYENDKFVEHLVEKNVGPANLDVVHHNGKEYILAANHTANEAAIYEVIGD